MALRKFTPDLDLYDPDDDEGWIGTWEHDDGTSLYGQGDPDMGRELLAANDAEPLGPDGIEPNQPALDANAPRADFQSPYQSPDREAMTPAPARVQSPAVPQSSPAPMAGADAIAPSAGWDDDVPPQVASALREQAEAAGLNPDILAAIIKHESGWDPSRVNKDTGKHGGLIQFDRDVTWPGVAKAAGRPDVTWEQALGMSAEEQVPFVVAYYKDKGLRPESSAGDYYKRTFMPGFAGEKDDFVLGERGSDARVGNLRSGTVYEQNQSLDLNKDGRITNAEVAQTGENKYRAGGAGGRSAPMAPGAPASMGAPPLGAGMPSSMAGMPASEMQVNGVPMSSDQMARRQQGIMDSTHMQMAATQQAEKARVEGRAEATQHWVNFNEQQKTNRVAEAQKAEAIAVEARTNIDRELGAEVQKVDPKRYVKNMSTAERIFGALALLGGALGQAAFATIGINSPNMAIDWLNKSIEADVQSQQDEIARGERKRDTRVAHWTRVLGSAESGAAAARQEARMHVANMFQARLETGQYNAEQKAAGIEKTQAILAAGQADANALVDRENQRLTIKYETPKAPATGPDKLLERIRALKETEQELRMSGMSDGEIDQFFRSSGLTRLGGETVPQATARQGVERQEDEETSKELEPLTLAETGWRKAQTTLDAIASRPFVSERYAEPGMMEGSDIMPGEPTVAEVNAFNQAISDAVNATIRAEKGSQTPEDVERVKQAIVGTGTIADIRRGIQAQLEKLELQRQSVSARRGASASRIETRQGAETMPRVSGKVYIPGAGPLR
jgi:hypothetical protein